MMTPEEIKQISIYCAWCKKRINGPETTDPARISHGICLECKKAMDALVERAKKGGR